MPLLSVAIMAHPSRESWVRQLAQKIDGPVSVIWDTNGTPYDTGRRAWLEAVKTPLRSTHHLVLQDDALICRDLVFGVEEALKYIPRTSPLSLYLGKSRPYESQVQGLVDRATINTSFLVTNKLNWGVGVVVPTFHVSYMVDYCDRRGDKKYDRRLSKWFESEGVRVWTSWPNLVDHRNGTSVMGHRREDRRSHNFIGEDESALNVDWSGGLVEVPVSRRKP